MQTGYRSLQQISLIHPNHCPGRWRRDNSRRSICLYQILRLRGILPPALGVAPYALGLSLQVKSVPARTMSVPAVIFCKWLIARIAKSLFLLGEDVSSTNCLKMERHFFELSTFNLLIFSSFFRLFTGGKVRIPHPR
jgi:hypothetical protein